MSERVAKDREFAVWAGLVRASEARLAARTKARNLPSSVVDHAGSGPNRPERRDRSARQRRLTCGHSHLGLGNIADYEVADVWHPLAARSVERGSVLPRED